MATLLLRSKDIMSTCTVERSLHCSDGLQEMTCHVTTQVRRLCRQLTTENSKLGPQSRELRAYNSGPDRLLVEMCSIGSVSHHGLSVVARFALNSHPTSEASSLVHTDSERLTRDWFRPSLTCVLLWLCVVPVPLCLSDDTPFHSKGKHAFHTMSQTKC